MRKIIVVVGLFVSSVYGQSEDARIVKIREAYADTNARIERAERNFAESDIFLTELIVNRGGTMYPAVGNFQETIRFYYTYGNREISPYPNRLLKIAVSTERAAVRESAEYVFNPSGQLIFAIINDGQTEKRHYFAGGTLIRGGKGAEIHRARTNEKNDVVRHTVQLTEIFRISLRIE